MSLILRGAATPYLQPFTKEAPSGVIIGVIGDDTAAIDSLLRIAAGLDQPASGTVEATAPQRWLGPADAFILAPAGLMALFHTFSMHGALIRARAILGLERLRKSGATILLASHEQALLSELADEIWWIDSGQLIMSGDPGEVLAAYNGSAAARLREWSSSLQQQLAPSMRRGDGRAEIIAIELVGASGQPSTNWQSGELVLIRVTVRFARAVESPVIGIMIRTRIGLEVYGTNTELEKLRLGPMEPGQTVTVQFAFRCELCPQEYSVTAASHDPNGVWHDWMEDAISFRVTDNRYTSGVANLRATVSVV